MMQHSLQLLVLVLVLTGVCPEAFTESCKQEQLMQCTDPTKLFSENKELAFFTDQKALDKLCPQLMEGLKCIDDFTQRCMKTLQRDSFHKLYSGTHSVLTNLCTNETYKRDFLRHQPCVAEVQKHHESCAKDFQERIQTAGLVGGSPRLAASGGGDHGDDAMMTGFDIPKRTMTPEENQEYMRRVCCSFQGYLQCSKESVLDTCDSEAAKFTEGYLDKMALPLIESHCKDHYVGSDNCAELLGNSSSWPASSALALLLSLAAALRATST
ncbi:uncharacterized protein LOC124170918 [Ischnura elegans]|uniref:uncharacterized protein LOC124170918 n=1 Tax=Ischnura elegans TaxID=197161 RepID=UPI001ED86B2C|nr:uncharacterized protein LOC124170918 [Ischnura elegans]